jgi:stage V sporulation protein S
MVHVPIPETEQDTLVKVAASSSSKDVATVIANHLYEGRRVRVRAIGAGAVNQAVKACALARGWAGQRSIDLVIRPGFETVPGNEGDVSSIVLLVIPA